MKQLLPTDELGYDTAIATLMRRGMNIIDAIQYLKRHRPDLIDATKSHFERNRKMKNRTSSSAVTSFENSRAKRKWNELVARYTADGLSKQEAIKKIAMEHPKVRENYVKAANEIH